MNSVQKHIIDAARIVLNFFKIVWALFFITLFTLYMQSLSFLTLPSPIVAPLLSSMEALRALDHPAYNPENFGYVEEKPDHIYDYKFTEAAQLYQTYKHINRPKVLRELFHEITKQAQTNTEKHLAVLAFLQKYSMHNSHWQPMHPSKRAIFDPLVLLSLGEMRCGHIARVAADLFDAAGFKTRIVFLDNHRIAEIFYDGSWHYFDADVFGGGQSVMIDGNIPSVSDLLSHHLPDLDKLAAYYEFSASTQSLKPSQWYPSMFYVSPNDGEIIYLTKKAQPSMYNLNYGWGTYSTEKMPFKTITKERYQPAAPEITRMDITDQNVSVSWHPAEDKDGDLADYKVFVSSSSRGWHYPQQVTVPDHLKPYTNIGWSPDMYEHMFVMPKGDLQTLTTQDTKITFPVPDKAFCVVVMARDQYGIEINKDSFFQSIELCSPK